MPYLLLKSLHVRPTLDCGLIPTLFHLGTFADNGRRILSFETGDATYLNAGVVSIDVVGSERISTMEIGVSPILTP